MEKEIGLKTSASWKDTLKTVLTTTVCCFYHFDINPDLFKLFFLSFFIFKNDSETVPESY